jgi:hypothetical protein
VRRRGVTYLVVLSLLTLRLYAELAWRVDCKAFPASKRHTGTDNYLNVYLKFFILHLQSVSGGGTVFFVQPDGQPRFLSNDAEREEAGSPDLLGCVVCPSHCVHNVNVLNHRTVRAALALRLHQSVGWNNIAVRESALAAVARSALSEHPHIRLLGEPGDVRIPIISLVILAAAAPEPSKHLHWGFVCALLNDVFGIQVKFNVVIPIASNWIKMSDMFRFEGVASAPGLTCSPCCVWTIRSHARWRIGFCIGTSCLDPGW